MDTDAALGRGIEEPEVGAVTVGAEACERCEQDEAAGFGAGDQRSDIVDRRSVRVNLCEMLGNSGGSSKIRRTGECDAKAGERCDLGDKVGLRWSAPDGQRGQIVVC